MDDANPANAHLLPYQLNSNAPAIQVPDILEFQQSRGRNAVDYFAGKFEELQAEYQRLYQLAQDTALVYNARYNFIPRVGEVYYLYGDETDCFLSLISPAEWNRRDFRGGFKFNTDNVWVRIDD